MEHFYNKIKGWFSWPRLYKDMINKFPSGSSFVEVGVLTGMSLSYLVVEMINSGKDVTITGVDGFWGKNQLSILNHNMLPVKGKFNTITGNSWESADKFADNSLDFVFIDADHEYESVKKDILAWLPKVKTGGILAGHDYPTWPGVVKAVDELFKDGINKEYINEFCWMVEIKDNNMINDQYMNWIKAENKQAYSLYKKGSNTTFAYGSHQPVLIHVLNTIKEGKVVEFGVGYHSTSIMNLICGMQDRELLSVETNSKWFDMFKNYKGAGHDVKLINSKELIKWTDELFNEKYAIAFVDSELGWVRQRIVERFKDNADYIIVHDTEGLVNGIKDCYNYDFSMFKHVHHFTKCVPMTSVLSNLDEINEDILTIFKK